MSYQALYRTYRPRTFEDVVGQDVIVKTLQNTIKHNKIGHAYIFSGPRGTGKTSVAKIFAQAVNCLTPEKAPCLECSVCQTIMHETVSDVIEIDAASNNGVDEIREIRDKVKYMPIVGKYKVYIIDEVHMLTIQAFNALLKTLEEPPEHVIFILATTEVNKLPPTILSRCQRFDFRGITVEGIEKRLFEIIKSEKMEVEDEAVKEISRQSDGGLRDAISLLDQVVSFSDGKVTVDDVYNVSGNVSKQNLVKLLTGIINKDVSEAFPLLNKLIADGKEVPKIVSDLIATLRDLLIEKNVLFESENKRDDLIELSKQISNNKIYFYLDILNSTQYEIRWTNQKRAYLELAIIKMMDHPILEKLDVNEKVEMLMNKINQLELDLKTKTFEVPAQEVKRETKKPSKVETKKEEAQTNDKTVRIEVTVRDIENILNNGDREKRMMLQKQWTSLENIKDPHLQYTAELLAKGEVVACNNNTALLVYDDKTTCVMMLNNKYKKTALEVLNKRKEIIENYICIDKANWNVLHASFLEQWKDGNKKPTLPELKLNLFETFEEKWQPESVKLAIDFFGKDIVKTKE